MRKRRFDQLDLPSLIEEIEAMAPRDKKMIESNLVVLLIHLLEPEQPPTG